MERNESIYKVLLLNMLNKSQKVWEIANYIAYEQQKYEILVYMNVKSKALWLSGNIVSINVNISLSNVVAYSAFRGTHSWGHPAVRFSFHFVVMVELLHNGFCGKSLLRVYSITYALSS